MNAPKPTPRLTPRERHQLQVIARGDYFPVADAMEFVRLGWVKFAPPWNFEITPEGRKALETQEEA